MGDVNVVRAMLNHDMFVRYSRVLFDLDNLEREFRQVLITIQDYFEKYPDREYLSEDDLKLHFDFLNPSIRDRSVYNQIFDRIKESKVTNEDLLIKALHRIVEQHYASKMVTRLVDVINGHGSINIVTELLEEQQNMMTQALDTEADVCNLSLKELLSEANQSGLTWDLKFLKETVGNLRPGTLVHVFARPETGKSSFGLFSAVDFAQKIPPERCILYLNNEEPIKWLKLRMYSAAFGVSRSVIEDHVEYSQSKWDTLIGNRVKAIGEVRYINQVEQYLKSFRPEACIIDQGPKVQISNRNEVTEVRALQLLYENYRRLAVRYNTVIITLGQADASADGKMWIGLNNLDSSKVGVPGELDVAIGIGRIFEPGMENRRFFNICKNKLTGIQDRTGITFDHVTCQFKMEGSNNG